MIYLASKSPRRKEILAKLKLKFKVVPSTYIERMTRGLTPRQLTIQHAVGKAEKAVVSAQSGIVLGSDTVVVCAGKILGKPKNLKEARQMIKLISGRSHDVMTAIALRDLKTGKIVKGAEKTKVFIRKIEPSEIDAYIEAVNSYDKAGGYAIQMNPKIVTEIRGSHSNVIGLPEELLTKLLKKISV